MSTLDANQFFTLHTKSLAQSCKQFDRTDAGTYYISYEEDANWNPKRIELNRHSDEYHSA